MSPFDLVLMSVGALLTLVGVYLFASGKMRDKASRVEAFGIKLDVTNPSLILILAGVGLMLVPRFVPEPVIPEFPKPTASETAQAPALSPAPAPQPPSAAPSSPPSVPAATPSPSSAATSGAGSTAASPPSVATRPVPSASSAPAASPGQAKPVAQAKPVTQVRPTSTSPATARLAAQAVETAPAAGAHPATPPVAGPRYLVAALGTPNRWKRFWDDEQEAGYSLKLAQVARERLRRHVRDARVDTLSDASAVTTLMQNEVTRQRRCEAGGFTALLVFTVAQSQVVISSVESAYWPELAVQLHPCHGDAARRETHQLAPRGTDRFPFEADMTEHLDRMLRDHL